jgi:hypothetical protein
MNNDIKEFFQDLMKDRLNDDLLEDFIDLMLKDCTKEQILDFVCRQHQEVLTILLRK